MEYVTELLGTFVFVSAILFIGQPLIVALVLLSVIYLLLAINGRCLINPAVSLALYFTGDLTNCQTVMHILVELLGGISAVLLYTISNK